MMTLAPKMGRLNAHHVVEAACKTAVAEQKHLKDVIAELDDIKNNFSTAEISAIFKPESYLGNIQAQIDAVLQEARTGVAK